MAEEEADVSTGEEGEEAPSSSRGKKMGLIAALVVVLLGGGGTAAYFMGLFGGSHTEEAEHAEEGAEGHGDAAEGAPAAPVVKYYELPQFIVNLSSNTGQTSFIRINITLELPSEEDYITAQQKIPVLQDHFNTYLRDLRASDLAGSAGIYRLREELLARANKSLAPARVSNILFTEILVQ